VIDGSINDQASPGSLKTMLIRGTGMGGAIGSVLYSERADLTPDTSNLEPKREYYLYNAIGSTVALTMMHYKQAISGLPYSSSQIF